MSKKVTAEDLEYGLSILARILDTQGDEVWPLFERLERELADTQSRRRRVKQHLSLSIPTKERKQRYTKSSSKIAAYNVRYRGDPDVRVLKSAITQLDL